MSLRGFHRGLKPFQDISRRFRSGYRELKGASESFQNSLRTDLRHLLMGFPGFEGISGYYSRF